MRGHFSGDCVSFRSVGSSLETTHRRRNFPATYFSDTDHTRRSAWRRSPTFVKAPASKEDPRAVHAPFSGRRLHLTRRRVRAREAFSGDAPPPPASPAADQHPYLPGSPIRALHVPLLGIFVSVSPPNSLSGEVPATFSPPQSLHVPWEVFFYLSGGTTCDLRPSPFFGGATPQSEAVLGLSSIQIREYDHQKSDLYLCYLWISYDYSEKLVGSENYLSWSASVELWFMGQGYEDHLVTQEADIPEVDRVQWRKIDAQLCQRIIHNDIQRLYKVASAIGHLSQQDLDLSTYIVLHGPYSYWPSSDLEPIRDQILGSSSVPSLDDVFARLLRISSTQTLSSDSASDSSVLVSQTTSRGGRQWYPITWKTSSHCPYAQSSDSPLPQPLELLRISDISSFYCLCCPTWYWFGPSSAFSTLTSDRSTRKTIGIGRESQGLYHLTSDSSPAVCISTYAPLLIHNRLGHPSLSSSRNGSSFFHFVVASVFLTPFFSLKTTLFPSSSCLCCTCFVHILTPEQDKLSAKAMKCLFLGYSRLQKVLPVSEVLPIPIVSPPDAMPPRPLQVYHRRPRVVAPLPFPEAPADSLPIPSASPAPALPSPNDLPIVVRKAPMKLFPIQCWRQAMVDEMAALHSNGTWDLVVLPSGKSTVGCRWVYAVKVGPDGQVDRLKARLVAKGYTQVYGSDYGDTFSPVAKIASVRLLLSMAAMCSWPLYQLDIKNAFLHGDLAEEVYMEQPPGFVAQGESGLVCRLRRSLYGLKQSPRAWFSRFSSVVQEFGMLRSTADHSVFYHHNSLGQCIYLVVYVDDIVITGSDQDGIQKLKQHLFTHFQTKDLGKLKYFLGIEIAQSSSGVVLSQRKYALDILEETGMLDCKPVDTPHGSECQTCTRTGGAFRRPREILTARSHWDAVIRILRYIKSTPGQGVLYENRGHTQVVGYTDADWAGSPTDRVPLQGTVFLLEELRFGKDEQMKLICDNQAALHIASNPVFHERTKHIEVDCHFIREKIASGCVATSFVNSNDQLADIFTKSLRGPRIKYICNKLGAYDVYAPA
ncbi:Retrovirus-related Pol polyprotein from transposon RE2 [Vitis vinifera]|uniref:Retrovirus-related Pol polyprotein from transposon RE2 n=1 Tax=Vitis vinifera TaxID=29760 RepID=A0A438J7Z8_VITVI|nr:Retrovirus-related Pol polyprotein from transposon RE2 [Vitis vinifera]